MGNSEVGHLNLGAGAVVMQDLTRIDQAVENGELADNPVLRDAFSGRRARPPDRARVRRRRALRARPPAGADPARRRARGPRPRPARLHRRARHARRPRAPAIWRRSRAGWPTPAAGGSARSSAATGRWTATAAGSGSSAPTTCWSTGAPSTGVARAQAAAREAYERERDRRVHHADAGRGGGADPPGRLGVRVQLPPRPDARDHPRARRAGLRRGRPRRRRRRSSATRR